MWQAPGKRKVAMRKLLYLAIILLVSPTGKSASILLAQEGVHQIVDIVELPAELSSPGDTACFIEFGEQWIFLAKGGLIKELKTYVLSCSRELPPLTKVTKIKDIRYEFMLLDPHLVESGNKAFSGPDSMDTVTRILQSHFIDLIQSHAPPGPRYDLSKQLLSVYFHEEWTIDPVSKEIRKKVRGLTPVIWQLRQTAEGLSIYDGDTGLPVYYKTPLQRITLRQP